MEGDIRGTDEWDLATGGVKVALVSDGHQIQYGSDVLSTTAIALLQS